MILFLIYLISGEQNMVAKYKEDNVLNPHLPWNEKSEDLDNILFKQNGAYPKRLFCSYVVGESTQGKINVRALSDMGTILLNDQQNHYNLYHVTIPSKECFCGDHAVAMAVDNKTKTIYYHDSHGEDMRKEMKDFLRLLLPEYKIDINHSKQQEDVRNPFVSEENDNSCVLLTKYNLRDMWYKINGHKDKICDYSSIQARKDAWRKLRNIQKEEPTKDAGTTKFTIKFGAKKTPSKEEIEAQKQAEKEDFKYRMYNEPNYNEMLQEAVKRAKSNHLAYCKQVQLQRGGLNK